METHGDAASCALTATLADDIVRGHRQFGELVDALERTQRTEAERAARAATGGRRADRRSARGREAATTRQGLREEISELTAIEEAELPAKDRADG